MDYSWKFYQYRTIIVKDGRGFLSFRIREDANQPICYRIGNGYKFNREYLGVAVS